MTYMTQAGLETKFCGKSTGLSVVGGSRIQGYASIFGSCDQGGDIVEKGAYGRSLEALKASGGRVKMLWQHDPAQPIGIWDTIREDDVGLFVEGRLLKSVARAQEAAALIEAGAIDGLSIGYRTVRSSKDDRGVRHLSDVELWEVSLVTFPMLLQARVMSADAVASKTAETLVELAGVFDDARRKLAVRKPR